MNSRFVSLVVVIVATCAVSALGGTMPLERQDTEPRASGRGVAVSFWMTSTGTSSWRAAGHDTPVLASFCADILDESSAARPTVRSEVVSRAVSGLGGLFDGVAALPAMPLAGEAALKRIDWNVDVPAAPELASEERQESSRLVAAYYASLRRGAAHAVGEAGSSLALQAAQEQLVVIPLPPGAYAGLGTLGLVIGAHYWHRRRMRIG